MIAIVDNGMTYSSHSIYFIEVPAEKKEIFEKIVARCPGRGLAKGHENPFEILGWADTIGWRGENGACDLLWFSKYLSRHNRDEHDDTDDDGEPKPQVPGAHCGCWIGDMRRLAEAHELA